MGAETRQGLSYSYVEAGYVRQQVDFGNPIDEQDANSFGIQASWEFPNAPVFIQAGYLRSEFEEDTVLGIDLDASADSFSFGFGGHVSLADNTDLVLSADYLHVKMDAEACGPVAAPGGGGQVIGCLSDNADDSGFGFTGGVRSLVGNNKVELAANVLYTVVDSDGTLGGNAGIRYHFTDMVSAGLSAGVSEDVIQGALSIRLSW